MITLVWPWILLLLPLPLVVQRLLPPRPKQTGGALRLPDLDSLPEGASSTAVSRRRWPLLDVLRLLAWAALVLALARPQWIGEPTALPTTGRDLMLSVDISGSMRQEDMEIDGARVTRLTAVKAVVGNFIERRQGDRVGLILFGTQAYLQAPLTFDLASVETLLLEAVPGMAGGKTAIGNAIALAVKRLRERPAEQRVLVLLTDGASNAGEVGPERAAAIAADNGIRIHTIGVGADEMRMPGIFGNFGSRVVNPSADLDEDTLKAIAAETGGEYFRARNPAELMQIYALIDALEPVEQDASTYRPVQALYAWPAAVGFALLVLVFGAGFQSLLASRVNRTSPLPPTSAAAAPPGAASGESR